MSDAITQKRVYDRDSNRAKETSGGTTTVYIGNYFEWAGSTATMKSYYYAGATRIAMRTGASTLNYLLSDHLGSTSVSYNTSTGAVSAQRYTRYGAPRGPASTLPTDYKFTGQRSEEAGLGSLYDYNARFYSPALGRFLSPDTIVPSPGNPQSLNRYSYVGNSPVCGTDPDGHCWPVCTALIGGAIGAGIGATSVALPQMIRNIRDGQPLTTNIDPAEVGKAAAVGFVSGAISGATAGVGTGLAATIGVGAVSNVLAGQAAMATDNVLSGRAVTTGLGNVGDMALDAVTGGIGGASSYGLQKALKSTAIKAVAKVGTHNDGSDIVVLGTFPEYLREGNELGMTYFQVSPKVYAWTESKGIGWASNQQFLDNQMAAGKSFAVALGFKPPEISGTMKTAGRGLTQELAYLKQKGYVVRNGLWVSMR